MNNVLFDYLDDFVVVYLDDIVIYSRTLEEHVNHLSLVLSQLRKYTLYVKMEKCEFAQQEIKFLGHLVSKNQAPRHVKDLRSFLGLANYYRKFIAGYSKKAASLTDLLKKDAKWIWSEQCEEAFQNLKNVIASEPILKLPDFELPFEVHTDASDKAIGGVLVQEDVVSKYTKLKE
uniref:Reverse transcriptase domain-containing protein n=1 Tax=Solanum lycopersicum TaxID=4081 RepID=A0A3Q7EEM6_SOLLC